MGQVPPEHRGMERLRGFLSIGIFIVLIGFIGLSGFRLITGLVEQAHRLN